MIEAGPEKISLRSEDMSPNDVPPENTGNLQIVSDLLANEVWQQPLRHRGRRQSHLANHSIANSRRRGRHVRFASRLLSHDRLLPLVLALAMNGGAPCGLRIVDGYIAAIEILDWAGCLSVRRGYRRNRSLPADNGCRVPTGASSVRPRFAKPLRLPHASKSTNAPPTSVMITILSLQLSFSSG